MHSFLASKRYLLPLFALAAVFLLVSLVTGPSQQAAAQSETATLAAAPAGGTPTVTPTRQPAQIAGPSATPTLPPEEEIGSTDGIVAWGVLMVALIFGVLLWHRPDWARRRSARGGRVP
jgi:hypothetical protein